MLRHLHLDHLPAVVENGGRQCRTKLEKRTFGSDLPKKGGRWSAARCVPKCPICISPPPTSHPNSSQISKKEYHLLSKNSFQPKRGIPSQRNCAVTFSLYRGDTLARYTINSSAPRSTRSQIISALHVTPQFHQNFKKRIPSIIKKLFQAHCGNRSQRN